MLTFHGNLVRVKATALTKAELDEAIAATGAGVDPWTLHDLRRTAATSLGKLGVSQFIQKRILNHANGEVTGIYDRYEYLPEKRHALDQWARFVKNLVEPAGANVVPLRVET